MGHLLIEALTSVASLGPRVPGWQAQSSQGGWGLPGSQGMQDKGWGVCLYLSPVPQNNAHSHFAGWFEAGFLPVSSQKAPNAFSIECGASLGLRGRNKPQPQHMRDLEPSGLKPVLLQRPIPRPASGSFPGTGLELGSAPLSYICSLDRVCAPGFSDTHTETTH